MLNEKGTNIESIVRLNKSLPPMISAKRRINTQRSYTEIIKFFDYSFETMSSQEKGILYRVLTILSAGGPETNLLRRLEMEFYDKIETHDFNTILNFSAGINLDENLNFNFYNRTSNFVYQKLATNMRFLFLDLKVIQLANSDEQSVYLEKIFDKIKVIIIL